MIASLQVLWLDDTIQIVAVYENVSSMRIMNYGEKVMGALDKGKEQLSTDSNAFYRPRLEPEMVGSDR